MEQLRLNIIPTLTYSAASFIEHAGVRSIIEQVVGELKSDRFRIYYLLGKQRTGKTHLSIHLADRISKAGYFPRMAVGSELASLSEQSFRADEVVIIDDADAFFNLAKPGLSGPFVNLVEKLRVARAALILLSAKESDELPCDQHIMSRIKPGLGLRIERPDESELAPILGQLAKQRGLKLSDRNVAFILRRLGRDIPSLELYLERLNHLSQVLGKSIKQPLMADAML